MNRTDRLYALVEELRAAAPRARTADWLADHFEVTARTVQRDLSALQQAGVPIWSTPGPGGGYIDPAMTLPPVTFTASEATAMAVALAASGSIPFAADAASALRKVMGAMTDAGREHARQLTQRIRLLHETGELTAAGPVLRAVEQAMTEDRVLSIDYLDKSGVQTHNRLIEPHSLAGSDRGWYLLAWCRLREGGRTFRLDRISGARITQQRISPRRYDQIVQPAANVPPFRPVSLDE